jgi:type VI secretion system protein VasD
MRAESAVVVRGRYERLRVCVAVAISAALVVLSGCAAKPPKDIEFSADIVVSENLNPDASGRASPLMLAIYQLKSIEKFQNDDFFSVFDPQGGALGDDLLRREQMMLQPGASQLLEAQFDPETAYIGLVGAFSDLENAQWRDFVEIPEESLRSKANIFKNQRLKIVVEDHSVSIMFVDG